MATNAMNGFSLPPEARTIIWRVFGEGESPLTGRSTYDLVQQMVEHYVPSTDANPVIEKIRSWFESHGNRHWLRHDVQEPVAELILEGIGADRSENTAWAIGSIDVELAAGMIASRWSKTEVDSFVDAALAALAKACERDRVLDASRSIRLGLDAANARILRDAAVCEGRVETFRSLLNQRLELVIQVLHPAVANLTELMLVLQPDRFRYFVERLDHPVVQARVARRMITEARPSNHRVTLDWIHAESCDALVALAIVYSLETVNKLDYDIRFADTADTDQHTWSTELRPPRDDLDRAADLLLAGLVDRLSLLDPLACVRWIGELLTAGPTVLHSRRGGEKPLRANQLESACTKLLATLVRGSWSSEMLAALRAGLSVHAQPTWTRHLAELAWAVRATVPERAADIAQTTLKEHRLHVDVELERNQLFLDWGRWDHREWIRGLGSSLALSDGELDVTTWVMERCRELPLTAWDADAEENHLSFLAADRVARHWFLVAFHAIEALAGVGNPIGPATVRFLAETLWGHCRFVGQYLHNHPESSVEAEHAARCAVEFGEPSDLWLVNQARNLAVGPRILWALIDQRALKNSREGESELYRDELIATELASITSERFGDGRRFGLETLRYCGYLWLSLGAIDEAEQTAIAMLESPQRLLDRGDKILALKLLALVAAKRTLARGVQDRFRSLYGELWSVYTPGHERVDRQQIDELLQGSVPTGQRALTS